VTLDPYEALRRTDDEIYEALRRSHLALAEEIRRNPDKSWQASLIDRYKQFLRDRGQSDDVAPIDGWSPGSVEITEAVLRSGGYAA
jgi:hypothetical protein